VERIMIDLYDLFTSDALIPMKPHHRLMLATALADMLDARIPHFSVAYCHEAGADYLVIRSILFDLLPPQGRQE